MSLRYNKAKRRFLYRSNTNHDRDLVLQTIRLVVGLPIKIEDLFQSIGVFLKFVMVSKKGMLVKYQVSINLKRRCIKALFFT